MFGRDVKRACAALALSAAFGLAPATASADETAKSALARDALHDVPVFFVAGADGLPPHEDGGQNDEKAGVVYYLTRAQASIAVGLAHADRAAIGRDGNELHVEVSNLGDAARAGMPHSFVRPISHLDAAASVPGVPLFMVRDKEGTPFTVRDGDSRRRVFFYLSEKDAKAFVARVLTETNRRPEDVQLSIVSLDQVLDAILTSRDPLVQDWTILSSAETRMDADNLRSSAAQAQLAPAHRSE